MSERYNTKIKNAKCNVTEGTQMPEEARANSDIPQQTEVAIVGAGPIGLMLANLLGLAGVQVTVLERNA